MGFIAKTKIALWCDDVTSAWNDYCKFNFANFSGGLKLWNENTAKLKVLKSVEISTVWQSFNSHKLICWKLSVIANPLKKLPRNQLVLENQTLSVISFTYGILHVFCPHIHNGSNSASVWSETIIVSLRVLFVFAVRAKRVLALHISVSSTACVWVASASDTRHHRPLTQCYNVV